MGMPKSDVEPIMTKWGLNYMYSVYGDTLMSNLGPPSSEFEFGLSLHVIFDHDGRVKEVDLIRFYPAMM